MLTRPRRIMGFFRMVKTETVLLVSRPSRLIKGYSHVGLSIKYVFPPRHLTPTFPSPTAASPLFPQSFPRYVSHALTLTPSSPSETSTLTGANACVEQCTSPRYEPPLTFRKTNSPPAVSGAECCAPRVESVACVEGGRVRVSQLGEGVTRRVRSAAWASARAPRMASIERILVVSWRSRMGVGGCFVG